ncbi:branched-chain amino acid transporter permease [Corynebacterium flavescens]|uniref:branched-chain amino acid transporter permease n=1 Tax=Corynebacterium flavescens TaxID=28028 RepID=UPI0028973B66|nr:AzlD domain-containing protein [Corynebacterium flavescens]
MVVAVLLPIAVVTVLLRQLPFSFVRVLKESQLIGLLGITMPVGVMTVLVVYTLRSQAELPGGVAAACLAAAVTAALHLWRRHSALSIFGGTAFYMVLVNLVF